MSFTLPPIRNGVSQQHDCVHSHTVQSVVICIRGGQDKSGKMRRFTRQEVGEEKNPRIKVGLCLPRYIDFVYSTLELTSSGLIKENRRGPIMMKIILYFRKGARCSLRTTRFYHIRVLSYVALEILVQYFDGFLYPFTSNIRLLNLFNFLFKYFIVHVTLIKQKFYTDLDPSFLPRDNLVLF